ncbi:uncharacterized protein LOC142356331, partial [Convolutriloba macropyga]|uniref:uncharacterized protein LOC142356331 n=1 Tax=Convolutriloba macropyga TaxID=536237 RepID=UPI003F522D3E
MSLLTTVGTNVDKILTLAAFLYFTLPEGVMGTSFKTCPTCGLVDYSGLMGTDDCYTKMMVASELGEAYGINMNASYCDFAQPMDVECPLEDSDHCFFMRTCATIEESNAAAFGGVYGHFCVHVQ